MILTNLLKLRIPLVTITTMAIDIQYSMFICSTMAIFEIAILAMFIFAMFSKAMMIMGIQMCGEPSGEAGRLI